MESHAVRHSYATAQRLHALDVAVGNCFAVIEEQVKGVKRNVGVHRFVDMQCPLDSLVVSRVYAKRPTILHEMANHRFQFAFHNGEHVRARHEKVFEVRGGENQHFSRAIDTIEVVAVAGPRHLRPTLKVSQFLLRPLRKEVICETNRQLAIAVQFVHYAIVVGIVLKSASGVDRAGNAEAVELAEEEPGRIKLIFAGELWSLSEGGIENVGVGVGDEKTRGISVAITLNLTRREIG